eukprot:s6678_g1.t1
MSAEKGEKTKSQVAIRFKDAKGIETPPPPKAAAESSNSSGWDMNSLLNWFPKVGVFGIALIGVIFWNIKKVSGQTSSGPEADDFDEELFKEKLRERRAKAQDKEKEQQEPCLPF